MLLPVKSQFLLAVDSEEYDDDTSDVSSSSLLLPYTDGTLIFLRLLGESKHLSTLSFLLGADAGEPASDRFVIDLDLWLWLIEAGGITPGAPSSPAAGASATGGAGALTRPP